MNQVQKEADLFPPPVTASDVKPKLSYLVGNDSECCELWMGCSGDGRRHQVTTKNVSCIKEIQLTTKLTTVKLVKSMHDVVECSASCLLNGVNHI